MTIEWERTMEEIREFLERWSGPVQFLGWIIATLIAASITTFGLFNSYLDYRLQKETDKWVQKIDTLIANRTTETKIGVLDCHKFFTVDDKPSQTISFLPADCGNVQPEAKWTYAPSLVGTTIAEGFTEYEIDPNPLNPTIKFYKTGKGNGKVSEVRVMWTGFSPRAF